jgi:hypothetical protein
MMASRGMGAINPKKMPTKKVIHRTDNPDDVDMYAEGGSIRGPNGPGSVGKVGGPGKPKQTDSLAGKYSTLVSSDLQNAKAKAESLGLQQDVQDITAEENLRARLKGQKNGGKVNAAGNYTKPSMRKSLFNSIKNSATQGTVAGQWSARKAQLLAKRYKEKGGGYRD